MPSEPPPPEPILVICDDLFFWAGIQGSARRLGVEVVRVRDYAGMEAALAAGGFRRVLADLACRSVDAVAWAPRLKALSPAPELVAFLPHVDEATRRRAGEAGFDHVLPNSRFHRTLRDWLT